MSETDGTSWATPPYRIRTERLTIRCWEPRDAPLLKDALDSSLDHLRPWMPWALEEPRPLDEKVELLRAIPREVRSRPGLRLRRSSTGRRPKSSAARGSIRGSATARSRSATGYAPRALGAGLAREATAALTYVAFRVCQVDRVEIRIDPANEASLRIPRALGFVEEGTLRRRLPAGGDGVPRDMVLFAVVPPRVRAVAVRPAPLEAFDAAGRRMLV